MDRNGLPWAVLGCTVLHRTVLGRNGLYWAGQGRQDMHSKIYGFHGLNYQIIEKTLRCHAREGRTDEQRRKVENSAVFWLTRNRN